MTKPNRKQRKRKQQKRKRVKRQKRRGRLVTPKTGLPVPTTSEVNWLQDFEAKYRTAINTVITQTMPLEPSYYCGQISLIAKRVSRNRLSVASGWLIIMDDPQSPPLLANHAWNESDDGTRIDLSPWNECPFPHRYVRRQDRDDVSELMGFPVSEEWHVRLDNLLDGSDVEGNSELEELCNLVEFVANGGTLTTL